MISLQLSEGVAIYPFDASGEQALCLLEISNGTQKRRFTIPAALGDVLRCCKTSDTEGAIEEKISQVMGTSLEQAADLVNKFLVPNSILQEPGSMTVPALEARPRVEGLFGSTTSGHSIKLRFTIAAPRVVAPLTSITRFLFSKWVLLGAVPVVLWSQWLILRSQTHFAAASPALFGVRELAAFFLVSTVAGLVHELGHASALRHCGADSASIGWGLYLWFPVLYTDLSAAWRMKRAQRILVDLGGVYFHLLFVACLTALIRWKHLHALFGIVLLIDAEIAFAMNPFFKMDGYWIVADAVGVPNLRAESKRIGTWIARSRRGQPSQWTWKDAAIASYTILSCGFFISMTFLLVRAIAEVAPVFRSQCISLLTMTQHGHVEAALYASLVVSILWKILFAVGVAFTCQRILHVVNTLRRGGWIDHSAA